MRFLVRSSASRLFCLYAAIACSVSLSPLSSLIGGNKSESTATADEIPAASESIDVAKVDAYLAAPMLQLANELEKSGHRDAANACRKWPPVRRPDAITAFFSSASTKGPAQIENDPAIAAAFLNARKETASRSLRGALKSAENNNGTLALELLWRTVREDPNSLQARRLLGLPAGNTARSTTRTGRAAPNVLGWPQRSFLVGQSQHFRVFSTAPKSETIQLAEDLERYFEVWSQVFFQQWTTAETICRQIKAGQPIRLPNVICEVVLFGDRSAYIRTLGADNPASSQSTGYYSPEHKLTLLFAGDSSDNETRYHEMTHQLLQEGVPSVVESPGIDSGFWIVEGIASYMESIQFGDSFATVGGWHAPRLQYSRSRILPTQQVQSLESILPLSRDQFQNSDDLAALYSTSAAYIHMLSESPRLRDAMFRYLRGIYQGRDVADVFKGMFKETPSSDLLVDFLKLTAWDEKPLPNPILPLKVMCLNRAEITAEQLLAIEPQTQLTWLDLGWLKVNSQQVARLVGEGTKLNRLNLEGTLVNNEITKWLAQQRGLEELDLSFTRIDDQTIESLRVLNDIETLWLTGTDLGADAIPALKSLRSLSNLDVQRTSITDNELSELKQSLPNTKLNPLILKN